MMTDHPPCDAIKEHQRVMMDHHALLGGMEKDIIHIKRAVDNGLSKKLSDVRDALEETERGLIKRNEDLAAKVLMLDEQSWLTKLLTGGTKQLILAILGFSIISAISTGGVTTAIRALYFKDVPGQVDRIAKIQASSSYHSHTTAKGTQVLHANDPNLPAWVLDEKSGNWIKAPQFRTDSPLLAGAQ